MSLLYPRDCPLFPASYRVPSWRLEETAASYMEERAFLTRSQCNLSGKESGGPFRVSGTLPDRS